MAYKIIKILLASLVPFHLIMAMLQDYIGENNTYGVLLIVDPVIVLLLIICVIVINVQRLSGRDKFEDEDKKFVEQIGNYALNSYGLNGLPDKNKKEDPKIFIKVIIYLALSAMISLSIKLILDFLRQG